MAEKKKIVLNTGGGDAPGLNAVIRSATLAALQRGWEVWGIKHGYRGLLEPNGLMPLDRDAVRGIAHLGGTILGTANRGDPFHYPTILPGQDKPVAVDRSDEIIERFKAEGFDALVAIGGDGSLTIAKKLIDKGLPLVIGVPKTIDNDVAGTDITFGFDTAVSIATEAIDRLHTTTEAHERVMVVEVMGRHAGWIAVTAGLAGGADAILLPEIPFRIERVAEKVLQRERRGRRFSIVVAAEGANPAGGEVAVKVEADEFRRAPILGGIAERTASELARLTGKETRSIVLGHLQRGGHPSSADRVLALRFGAAAVGEIAAGSPSGMVSMRAGDVRLVPFEEAAGKTRNVPTDRGIVRSARELGICFGDEPETHFSAS
ncbi:MAG: ATP-dependent 6-phosphofructokinase [Polyangiaceae bacterium]|nr:ATP-dependent 6-phosphofructokinase [Polyangiaceae bacterium]